MLGQNLGAPNGPKTRTTTAKQPRSAENAPQTVDIQHNLKALDNEELRYAKAYGQGMMSDFVYKEQMKSLTERRTVLRQLQAQPQTEQKQQLIDLDPEKLVEPFKQFIDNLTFDDKVFITRKITDKIVATKDEVTICGFIPLMHSVETKDSTGKVKYEPDYRHRRPPQRRQVHPL